MTPARWIYRPHEPWPESRDPVATLGGKGAVLRTFCAAGLPAPPCFTISTDACREYLSLGRRWPNGLQEQVVQAVGELERTVGRRFGPAADSIPHARRQERPSQRASPPSPGAAPRAAQPAGPPRPLLLAVRSGAPVSMPGMLLTLLNCGLNRELAESFDDPEVWATYARFLQDFAAARGVELSEGGVEAGANGARRECLWLLKQYEHVCGQPFPQDPWELLQHCISAVFDSWSSERAAAFRRLNRLEDAVGTAVTVQAMLATEAAGVLFSHDPRQPCGDAFVIEAVRGRGDQLVSGRAEPQRYEVPRWPTALPSRCGPEGPSSMSNLCGGALAPVREPILDSSQLHDLCALAVRIEPLLGGPVDVEWGYGAGQAWLFQARRMDRPQIGESLARIRTEELARLERSAREHGTRLWVRHNLGETLPAPTPLTWDLVRRWMSGRGGYGRLYRSFGYAPSPRVCEHGFLELVAGRIYADPDRLAEIFCAGLPLGYDLAALQADPQLLERGPRSLVPERADGWLLFRLPALLWTMWRASRRARRESERAVERFERQLLPRLLSYVQQQRRGDLTHLSDSGLTALLEERCVRVLDEFAAETLRPAFFAALAMHALESRLVRLMGPQEGGRCARDLVLGLAEPPAVACEASLYRVAQGQLSREQFLERFGHRGPDEMELAAPRWRDVPDQLERLVAWLRDTQAADPETLRQRVAEECERAWQSLPQRLADHGAASFTAAVGDEARKAQQLLPWRESARHAFLMGYELIRQTVREIGRRLDLAEEVFFLHYDELQQFPGLGRSAAEPGFVAPSPSFLDGLFAPQSWREVLRERQQRWQLLQRLAVPEAIDPAHLEVIGAAPQPPTARGVRMEATAVSGGTARGPVRIWTAARPLYDLPAGSVLVCASLDAGLTPLLLRAAAVVVECGGLLSHGAIVARQLGIPAVVLADARERLRDGQLVTVDGDRGCLLCERGAAS